jgi:hypothetical protein
VTAPPQPPLDARTYHHAIGRRAPWYQSNLAIWLLRLLSVVVIAVVVSTAHGRIDRREVAVPAGAIASGHLGAAYPPIPRSLAERVSYQPPGFPVAAAVAVAVWQGLTDGANPSGALTLAGFGAAALVVIAGGRLAGNGPGGRRREVLFLAAVTVSPFFRESLGNYFHPEDVLALGLLLLSLSLAAESRWVWAGAALGLAFASKQWVLLAGPALLIWADGRQAKIKLVGAAVGAAALLYAPFVLVTPRAAWQVFRGPVPVPGGFVPQTTVLGMLRKAPFHVPLGDVNALARLLPLLFAIVLAAVWIIVMSRRYGALTRPRLDDVLGLVLACVAFRLVGDCIALSYYALPLSVLTAVVAARRSKFPAFAIAASLVLALWYGAGLPGDLLDPWTGALIFTIGVAVFAGRTLLDLRTIPAQSPPFGGRVLAGAGRGGE